MLRHDDSHLDNDFEELGRRLADAHVLSAVTADPIFYFVYSPAEILGVRKRLPAWIARLRNQDGLEVETLSLGEVLWGLIDISGRWEDWLEVEADAKVKQINKAVSDVLRSRNALVERVVARASVARANSVLFITDVELLHPYFRTRAIENGLNNRVARPTVFFYPGRRAGQYGLRFLEFHNEDGGYRSTIIGGVG